MGACPAAVAGQLKTECSPALQALILYVEMPRHQLGCTCACIMVIVGGSRESELVTPGANMVLLHNDAVDGVLPEISINCSTHGSGGGGCTSSPSQIIMVNPRAANDSMGEGADSGSSALPWIEIEALVRCPETHDRGQGAMPNASARAVEDLQARGAGDNSRWGFRAGLILWLLVLYVVRCHAVSHLDSAFSWRCGV